MHGYLYEMTTEVVGMEDWTVTSDFYNSEYVDYVRKIDEDERKDAIQYLRKHKIINDLFDINEEKGVIVFKGEDKIKEIKNRWLDMIQESLDFMKYSTHFMQFDLRRRASYGEFGDNILFCLTNYIGSEAVTPNEFFDWICNMENGTVIRINSVFDYHY